MGKHYLIVNTKFIFIHHHSILVGQSDWANKSFHCDKYGLLSFMIPINPNDKNVGAVTVVVKGNLVINPTIFEYLVANYIIPSSFLGSTIFYQPSVCQCFHTPTYGNDTFIRLFYQSICRNSGMRFNEI